jgi:cell division septation protein DedD
VASRTPDDGFHEIQLNGKQLVFLFMAATVVSVVIFLCGVLVGRGVRAERGAVAHSAAMNEAPTPDVVPATPATTTASVQPGADPTVAAPPPPVDDLSYSNRLEKSNRTGDDLKLATAKASESPAPQPQTLKTPSPAAKPVPAAVPPQAAASPTTKEPPPLKEPPPAKESPAAKEPPAAAKELPVASAPTPSGPGDGYAVQVAAVNVRSDADAIANRLTSKGYAAYVEVPPNGTGTVFRVRVGTFKTRREAETIAAKLQKEEQIKPWVTR